MIIVSSDNRIFSDDGSVKYLRPGYRLGVVSREMGLVLLIQSKSLGDIVFARERDAELAKAAMAKAGITCEQSAIAAGFNNIKRISAEAMAW